MKVYISDLHIGDGESKDDFIYDSKLIKLLNEINHQNNELYIVGDFIELMDAKNKKYLLDTVDQYIKEYDYSLLDEIYLSHKKLFDKFKEISKNVKVRYIVGNHDYYLLFDPKLREKVCQICGNMEIIPYYYDELLEIFIIHGNQFDVINRLKYDEKNRIIPSFGEYMVKYMSNNFDNSLEGILPDDLISDYDNISPQLDVFQWLEYVNEKYKIGYDLKSKWVESFIDLIRTKQVKKWLKINFPAWHVFTNLFVNKIGGMEFGEAIVRSIMFFRGTKKSDHYLKVAKKLIKENFIIQKENLIGYSSKDIIIPKNNIKGLIMGHNHKPSFNVFTGNPMKFYANTGAWKHTVTKNYGIDSSEFIRKNLISYLTIIEKKKKLDIKLNTEQIF
ncbi:metallophosphoesterase [Oceanotoga teriensis]|uniref:Calcineurin-like phosphoesterase domain-containing protein n=1 Tax=Oceanotoga teriensis TaxID=515440 RepID=A0AA45C822_9BACT|nr:metallophosphoesterase [Oceanotoga teriensis]MDO7976805.1 hypothetical protein [Oceanotoga teriensis]PWJ95881.1 hypothetical protein C7380_10359 [Oceanotoga teriensis]